MKCGGGVAILVFVCIVGSGVSVGGTASSWVLVGLDGGFKDTSMTLIRRHFWRG